MDSITLPIPDDWHLHLRDGAMLARVTPYTARRFARAIVMPNLKPPVTTVAAASAYRERIRAAAGETCGFTPLMTAYLTDRISPDELARGRAEGVWIAAKLYPAGATTNSDAGVTDIANILPALERMSEIGMPLLVHGEVTGADVDPFDREQRFIEEKLAPLVERLPDLKVVFEHITTRQAAQFVQGAPANVAATVTPQHILMNRGAIFAGGLRPHAFCLPVLKREEHRQAVLEAATSGSGKFFLGTDSAPHRKADKESDCGCAGLFNAPHALEAYAMAFDSVGALDKLPDFASRFGPAFYGLPVNQGEIRLVRAEQRVERAIGDGDDALIPFMAGEDMGWRVEPV